MPTPPVPPIASGITISYTTSPVPATRSSRTSGWRHARPAGDRLVPAVPACGLGHRRHGDGRGRAWTCPTPRSDRRCRCTSRSTPRRPAVRADPVDAPLAVVGRSGVAEASGRRRLAAAAGVRAAALRRPEGVAGRLSRRRHREGRWVRLVTTAPERLGDVRDRGRGRGAGRVRLRRGRPAARPEPRRPPCHPGRSRARCRRSTASRR